MEALISIIVPAYQVENYLNRCLESIVNQTYKNLEIILVDDGSTDKTAAICDSWAKKDPRVKVIHKCNEGLSIARNTALLRAEGEYVCFVDSDDYIDLKLCENILSLMQKENADIVTFNAYKIDEDGQNLHLTEDIKMGELSLEIALYELMRGNLNHYACNKMYKKEVFQDIRFPEGRIWEDMATTYRLFLKAKKIYCCEDAYYYYVQHSKSISANINEKALRDIYLARSESYLALKDRFPRVEEVMFPNLVQSAIRLYDRSLWADVDQDVLKQAKRFLIQNKQAILKRCFSKLYWMYYYMPSIYRVYRRNVHFIGTVVRTLKR